MELYLVYKGDYADFIILGICTDREIAEVLALEVNDRDGVPVGAYGGARVTAVAANTMLSIGTNTL